MRNSGRLIEEYSDAIFASGQAPSFFVRRDICLVDLCLHFLTVHAPNESVWATPTLLQGHLAGWLPERDRHALFRLRQFANSFCSRLAWRAALAEHGQCNRTAYQVLQEKPVRRSQTGPAVTAILGQALLSQAPYGMRDLIFGKPGPARLLHMPASGEPVIQIPTVAPDLGEPASLLRRAVNPPLSVRWDTLLDVARQVDAREQSPLFPDWLPKLDLEKRLQKIDFASADGDFFRDGTLTLDGTEHLVGMLSSGKSTLVQALLFTFITPGYDKRVVVLSKDTASASELVARLRAHGHTRCTVVSSLRNRDVHLSAALWSTQGYPADQALDAAAALTDSLDTACPLDGFQDDDHSMVTLARKPCYELFQKKEGKTANTHADKEERRVCPLIGACPTHRQQRILPTASVIAMTPQAFLQMTPEPYAIRESLSFPESLQFLADVVLIDEADEVQRTFDSQCTQDQALLSPDGSAFTVSSTRALASSLSNRAGSQYVKPSNVQWHRQFNRLQDSISAIYHLFLKHGDALAWLASQKTFTSASIFVTLWRHGAGHDATASAAAGGLDQLAALSGALYNSATPASEQDPLDLINQIDASDAMRDAFHVFARLQPDVLEAVPAQEATGAVTEIVEALKDGPLNMFSSAARTTPGRISASAKKGKGHWQGRVQVPDGDFSRALAIVLALLTNFCLSSFSYLVRNQAAVEDDFGLEESDVFREARRIMRHYGSIIPRPLLGSAFGLMFEPAGESPSRGGTLRLINHLAVGRFILTNLHRLLADEGQAGPHVLLLSGTSWAGGASPTASPLFDVQWPVSAILTQPEQERDAIAKSLFEFVSLGAVPISVSGQLPEVRRENLKAIATQMVRAGAAGTVFENKWAQLIADDVSRAGRYAERQRAILVTNNYEDAKLVANTLAKITSHSHGIYCMVPDSLARSGEIDHDAGRTGQAFHPDVHMVPRSRVESFGGAPAGSILVAPLLPISRGHNIVLPNDRIAAVSSIYFLHRPHPRPDDMTGVIGAINRFAMDVILKRREPEGTDAMEKSHWFRRQTQRALDEGFALRTAYALMSDQARGQYSWDLITSLWQTIGRGIRGGVPVYVGFIDERFAPGIYQSPPARDTVRSSCLMQCLATLKEAITDENNVDGKIAMTLYMPFYDALKKLFEENRIAQ